MNIALIAASMSTRALQHVRRVLESEMLASVASGETMTQAHVGKLEMMEACGSELHKRGALAPLPPYVETDQETVLGHTLRLSNSIRVF